ncbi:AcrR family transcriptional regulator [Yoonia maritima]|uniref:AcrR family transcriptional regulator n=2 Tax=Yoonia maritima TaxID=1435347 RepID=A0A2T0VYY8_9RHOB|nr:AcrR family transcriptional regulator [Yoonia maritima]
MVIFIASKDDRGQLKFDHGQNTGILPFMEARPPQKRRIATRQRLIEAASEIVAESGFAALRVEDVVARAKVAKGTFFSHFEDKDRLMALLIGQEMDRILKQIAQAPAPDTVDGFGPALAPLMGYMGQNRVVFDVVIRFSGAAAIETTELISVNFMEQVMLFAKWVERLQPHIVRSDVDAMLLAEGIQAFIIQAIALEFCALHNSVDVQDRLAPYLRAWLAVPKSTR